MSNLQAIKKGKLYPGAILKPHRYPDGRFVATTSKHEIDYVWVDTEEELESLYLIGYGARMSNSSIKQGPSYISHDNIILASGIVKGSILPVSSHLKRLTEEADLDKDSKSKSRKEQAFLRSYLCRGKSNANCTICGHEFPIGFLFAAHIKKRSKCNKKEKLDFDNIATLMCKSGCDDLFEKGYIFVSGGYVQKSAKRRGKARIDEIISDIAGRTVSNWLGSRQYYKWHEKEFDK